MQYQKKPYVIDAIGVPFISVKDNPYELEEIPDWLQQAFDDRVIRPFVDDKDYWMYHVTLLRTYNAVATPEHWFVREPDGAVNVYKNEQFEEKFEPTPRVEYQVTAMSWTIVPPKTTLENIVPTTPEEAPIGHPEPPHETNAGQDSTPAPELAEVAEDQLIAEEESNPT